MEAYLDNAATTRVDDRVREVVAPLLADAFGNPSSRHPLGARAADALDRARRQVARATGVEPASVVFTSGGTEANNLALLGFARAAGPGHVLVGATEHPCVRDAADALREEGYEVETAALGADGLPDPADWRARLRPDTRVASCMLVNNEFGTIYDVAALARAVRAEAPGAVVHVDAVQAFGKLDVRPVELGVDSVAISSHKVHGPKGAGALVLATERRPRPLVFGGGQERGVRSGTEPLPAIVGFGAAAELAEGALDATWEHLVALRRLLVEALADLEGVEVLCPGGEPNVLPGIVSVRVPGAPAEVYLHHLEARGVYVSAGSACQEKKKATSPALLALGLNAEEARSVLRFSTSRDTTLDEVRHAAAVLAEVREELCAALG